MTTTATARSTSWLTVAAAAAAVALSAAVAAGIAAAAAPPPPSTMPTTLSTLPPLPPPLPRLYVFETAREMRAELLNWRPIFRMRERFEDCINASLTKWRTETAQISLFLTTLFAGPMCEMTRERER